MKKPFYLIYTSQKDLHNDNEHIYIKPVLMAKAVIRILDLDPTFFPPLSKLKIPIYDFNDVKERDIFNNNKYSQINFLLDGNVIQIYLYNPQFVKKGDSKIDSIEFFSSSKKNLEKLVKKLGLLNST